MPVLVLAALVLLGGCATGASSMREVALGEHERVFAALPTSFGPVRVGEAEFLDAVAHLVLEMPLRLAPSHVPLLPGRRLALASGPLVGGTWQSELARSYGRFCERRGTPGDCLTLFEDGPHLRDDDKRRIALALAVGPALEGVDAEVRAMLSPARVTAMVSITLTAYMALLVAPEPVSKGAAAAFAVLMWGYLGMELWELIEGWMVLSEDSARATSFTELREAGERFGQRIGPNSVRILVMVGTAALGETAALMSKAPKLPGFAQAAGSGAQHGGVRMLAAVAETEKVVISAAEGSIRVVLPLNAVAMAARNGGRDGWVLPNGHRAFKSFDDFKDFMGPAGEGKQWHHIVEQRNVGRFGSEAIHNTENVVRLEEGLHMDVSALYSSKRPRITGSDTLTVRQWLSTQSYEAQRQFGLRAIDYVRRGIW
ncbi:hypothetical protein JRI60_43000 [Archangium violaceum]|nr:hypothetical protein [Archangium violaceum]QRN95749.1 hypothetical protein JRI60_43000 [Archangium violaceum]